jgi:copper homeostasis protein CutC
MHIRAAKGNLESVLHRAFTECDDLVAAVALAISIHSFTHTTAHTSQVHNAEINQLLQSKLLAWHMACIFCSYFIVYVCVDYLAK